MSTSSFEDLIQHINHKIVCVHYSDDGTTCKKKARNVAVECVTCHEVLMDFDREEKTPVFKKRVKVLIWDDPRYEELRCSCGNALEFKEVALRETIQPFVMKGGETDFEDYDTNQEAVYPTSVECIKCGTVVWSARRWEKDADKPGIILIKFGGHRIEITLDDEGSGTITSDLKEVLSLDPISASNYDSAIDGLESLILAQACAGIDVTSKEYIRALESAIDGISNNT